MYLRWIDIILGFLLFYSTLCTSSKATAFFTNCAFAKAIDAFTTFVLQSVRLAARLQQKLAAT